MRADGPFAQPATWLVLMFLGLILLPVTLYLYAAHASWTWMYIVNPETIPSFAILPLVVAHTGAVLLGYYVGARLIINARLALVAYLAGGGAALSLLGIVLFWGRLGHYGSFVEFEQNKALPIMDVKLGYVLVAVVVGVIASSSFLAFELLRDSRRVRSR